MLSHLPELLGFAIRLLHILIYFLYICNVIIHLIGNSIKSVTNGTYDLSVLHRFLAHLSRFFFGKLCFAQTALTSDCKFTNMDGKRGFVDRPENYPFSIVVDFAGGKGLVDIEPCWE